MTQRHAPRASLRVRVDLRATEPGFKSHLGRGIGRYARELWRALRRTCSDAGAACGVALEPLRSADLRRGWTSRRLLPMLPIGKRTIETHLLHPRHIARTSADVVHFLAHVDSLATGAIPRVVTVHDLIPRRFPGEYDGGTLRPARRLARSMEDRAVRAADLVLTVSESTKRDVIELLGVESDRIVVTPLAASSDFGVPGGDAAAARSQARQRLDLPTEGFLVLCVGGMDPRKNVPFLVRAFARMRTTGDATLLLAGPVDAASQRQPVAREIERLGLAARVRSLGHVPDAQLADLYHAADVLAFPSLYEGFGLPVLEAMASGLPVVCGSNSSLPEIAGDAAAMLPDGDIDAWARTLTELARDPGRRRAMSDAGVARAATFSWDRTAEQTLDVYRRLAGRASPTVGRSTR